MSIAKDLLFIIIFLLLVFILKKNCSLRSAIASQREYFIKTLSHDLRVSALAQIRGIDLLQKENNKTNQYELICEIDKSCKYSLEMINMLLNTYRYENGENILDYRTFNFSEIIKESFSKQYKDIEEKEIEIVYKMKDSEYIEADKTELSKSLAYLISTTVFYSDRHKKIIVFAKKNIDNLDITISYSGKSLTEEECRRMFANNPRFSTVGHGIKMYLCKKIIEFHGGKIQVNNLGKNINSFTFTIPAKRKKQAVKPLFTSKLEPFRL